MGKESYISSKMIKKKIFYSFYVMNQYGIDSTASTMSQDDGQ